MAKGKRKKIKKKSSLKLKTRLAKKRKKIPPLPKAVSPHFAKKIKIRVIGIGGGGSSIVSEIASRMKKTSFAVANTDLQTLKTAGREVLHFQFGQEITHGLGTGMNPELGREAALKDKERIKKLLEGFDLCILVVSLGGGTGSGAAPIFAKISRDLGNITYGIFTLPFKFEGKKKMEIAREALRKTRSKLNIFSVIPNERIFQTIDRKTPLKKAFSTINKALSESLEGIIEVIYEPGLINIDFADFKTVLPGFSSSTEKGIGKLAYLNVVKIERKGGSAKNLIEKVLNNPLYPYSIGGAKGVLLNIAGERELSLAEVTQISKTISRLVNKEAKIIFGISQSFKYSGFIKTTLLAIGCKAKIFPRKAPKRRKKVISKPFSQTSPQSPKIASRKAKRVFIKIAKKKSKKRKKKPRLIKVKITKPVQIPIIQEKEEGEVLVSSEPKVRKNALQLKREAEAQEAEMLAREKFWETPAFLRKKIIKEE